MSAEAVPLRTAPAVAPPRAALWTGRALSGLAVLFLLFDGVMKLRPNAAVREAFGQLGFPYASAPWIGALELACLLAYALPRTSAIGAVLLTGFLGGATAIHVRVGDPLLTHVLFPAYVGALVWGGLLLRDERLRALARSRTVASASSRDPAACRDAAR